MKSVLQTDVLINLKNLEGSTSITYISSSFLCSSSQYLWNVHHC